MVLVNRQLALFISFMLVVPSLSARVTHVEISSCTDILDGKRFGDSGPYERITGHVCFAVPVANIHNQSIGDLPNAVNLQNGEVEFSADFVAVRPKDATQGNGTLLLENPHRGQPRILSLVDGGDEDPSQSAGDAWLLSNGFTVVALGWQWDAAGPKALRLFAPIAKKLGGIHLPEISVPLATYTGWNLGDPSIGGATQGLAMEGAYLRFPKNAAEREQSSDPRKSIAERYPAREAYVGQFACAAEDLIQPPWILPDDRAPFLQRGGDEWDLLAH